MAQNQVQSLPTGATADPKLLPPFPTKQMLVLAICRLCEPIAFTSIFPYVYFMIEDFHQTDDPNKISTYAGMMTTAFALAEFATSALWGRYSDKVGRKPVVLVALFGTAVSMVLFGFSSSILTAMLARVLAGSLNGNISVMQTVVGEMVTVQEHEALAYMVMPLVWNVGSILGPMLGGALARPCVSYPELFPRGSIWDQYPYLLPNVVSGVVLLFGTLVGVLFMEETNAAVTARRDPGLELGRWMLSLVPWRSSATDGGLNAPVIMVQDEADTPCVTEATAEARGDGATVSNKTEITLNRQVLLNIASYGILAFHSMTFEQLFPMVLATEERGDKHISWPFKFVGGYGMDSKQIGLILSLQGIYSLTVTAFLFPFLIAKLGALRVFKMTAVTWAALYVLTPYVVLLPESVRMVGVYAVSAWKCTYGALAYPSNTILLINAVTRKSSLGTVNGIAGSTAALCRSFSPAVSGYLYSVGLELGYSGLAWWINAAVTVAGSVVSLYLLDRRDEVEKDECDEETSLLGGSRDPDRDCD